jgi:serine/threonine protein kinase
MINRIGQQLGNYRLIQSLGKGGFAEVYLGEHLYLKTFSAIKILQMQLSGDDIRQFMAEGQMLAQLQHPNIIRVLDFGVDHDTPYLVMDYAPNGTLRRRYPPGSILPVPALVSNVKEIALALQYAHDHHVVHRDVKPENMLLGKNNEVLLTDFGIATVIQTSRSQHTQSIIGTVSYMAPEQIRGHPIAASDQYALGITAYEWLCGERPFTGTFVEITTQQIAVPPTPLRQKAPSVPPAVEQIVMRALEKDPQRRFPSVKEFANALEYILSAPVQPVNNPSPTQSFVLPASMPTPTPLTPIPPTPRGPLAPAPLTPIPPTPPPPPAGPPVLVPALPKPDATYIYWPTFTLTMQDRQMISSGKLPQDSLRVTGQVGYMTPTSQLPVLQKQPPLSTRALSQVTVTRQAPLPGYTQGYTGVLTPRPSQPTTGQVVRSTAPSGQTSSQSRATGAIQHPGQQQQMQRVRTTNPAPVGARPTGTPGGLTPAQLASKRSASIWALTTTLLSMGLFFIQFIVKGNEANTISGQGFSSYQSGIAAVVVFFYILGIIGLITGIVSVARPGIPPETKSRGNWSIALTIIFMVVEVAMLAWLFS